MPRPPFKLMVAVDKKLGIGRDNGIPWNLPTDFAYLMSSITETKDPNKRNVVIFGRMTWLSIPEESRPFPGLNVILSRTMPASRSKDVLTATDFQDVLRILEEQEIRDQIETVWVLGGNEVYLQALKFDLVDEIRMTFIFADFDCDAFFPKYEWREKFEVSSDSGRLSENGIDFQMQTFLRKSS